MVGNGVVGEEPKIHKVFVKQQTHSRRGNVNQTRPNRGRNLRKNSNIHSHNCSGYGGAIHEKRESQCPSWGEEMLSMPS